MKVDEAKTIIKHYDGCFIGHSSDEVNEALEMAIASLEAWDKVKQEIDDLFSKPACYMPNYDAYKMFLEIIDKHLAELEGNNV